MTTTTNTTLSSAARTVAVTDSHSTGKQRCAKHAAPIKPTATSGLTRRRGIGSGVSPAVTAFDTSGCKEAENGNPMTNAYGDDDFDWSAAEDAMRDVVAQESLNVTLLNDMDLLEKFHSITDELRNRSEMLRPTTDTGRDLHSQRGAIRVELARRNLM
jgi:hypothetical protein